MITYDAWAISTAHHRPTMVVVVDLAPFDHGGTLISCLPESLNYRFVPGGKVALGWDVFFPLPPVHRPIVQNCRLGLSSVVLRFRGERLGTVKIDFLFLRAMMRTKIHLSPFLVDRKRKRSVRNGISLMAQ